VVIDVLLYLLVFVDPFEIQHNEDNCYGYRSDDAKNNLAYHDAKHVVGVVQNHLNNH